MHLFPVFGNFTKRCFSRLHRKTDSIRNKDVYCRGNLLNFVNAELLVVLCQHSSKTKELNVGVLR